jgi:hypothetical protein
MPCVPGPWGNGTEQWTIRVSSEPGPPGFCQILGRSCFGNPTGIKSHPWSVRPEHPVHPERADIDSLRDSLQLNSSTCRGRLVQSLASLSSLTILRPGQSTGALGARSPCLRALGNLQLRASPKAFCSKDTALIRHNGRDSSPGLFLLRLQIWRDAGLAVDVTVGNADHRQVTLDLSPAALATLQPRPWSYRRPRRRASNRPT